MPKPKRTCTCSLCGENTHTRIQCPTIDGRSRQHDNDNICSVASSVNAERHHDNAAVDMSDTHDMSHVCHVSADQHPPISTIDLPHTLPTAEDNIHLHDNAVEPNVPVMNGLQTCAVCHRSPTPEHTFVFILLQPHLAIHNHLIHRQFGDRTGMSIDEQVCPLCSSYVCPRTVHEETTPSWAYAWPAVIWTCLTKPHYANAVTFMQFLAYGIRASWTPVVDDWLPAMREAITIKPHFFDVSTVLSIFNEDIASGELPRLMRALNDTCFPQVRCPLGCYMYVDEVGEKLQLLPASHYLVNILTHFTAFHAQAYYFQGARQDWTTPITDLDWEVAPSLVVDNDKGLCILMCSNTTHSDARNQYIHVPSHPILGNNGPQVPDYLAPAVVTAKVIRSGRSNAYNTSFPVFEQRGNSGGLSTMRLSVKSPHISITDEVAMSSGFTLDQRPDILEYAKQSDMFQENAISETLDIYNYSKPTNTVINKCARQSTFMDLGDAYLLTSIHNAQAAASNDDVELHEAAHITQVNIAHCLFIVHPNTASGHEPFQISRGHATAAMPEVPIGWLLYGTLQSFLHVRLLHTRLLHSASREPNQALYTQLLQVCKACANSRTNQVPMKSATLLQLSAQLMHLYEGRLRVERLAQVLSDVCGVIPCNVTNNDWHFPDSHDGDCHVLLLTRRRRLNAMHEMPEQSEHGQWILLFALSFADADHVEVSFRWSPAFQWQHTGTRPHHRSASLMQFLVYCSATTIEAARQDVLQRCGGQSQIQCIVHGEYLLKQQIGSRISCCTMNCKTSVRWRCSKGLGFLQCHVGLCLRHFRQCMNNIEDGTACVGFYGPDVHNACHTFVEDCDDDTAEDDILLLAAHTGDAPDIPCNPLERYAIGANDYPATDCPITTCSSTNVSYLSERTSAVTLGHYLLNNHLQVLNRTSKSHKPPVSTQKVLQLICARTPEWTVPLLYPEAQLFPRIFWCMHGSAVTGALPAIFYTQFGQYPQSQTIASLQDHMYVRLMDGSLLTSRDTAYLQFHFDVMLNSALNSNSAFIACQKGLEHVTRKHNLQPLQTRESIMQFDEVDARRQVKQLSALLRAEGAWHYFITLTCNDSATMGVWPIRAAILKRSDPLTQHRMLQNYAVIMCRAWERTGRYIWKYIQYSPERPLGHVKCAWMRYEFQSAGALGNRPHIHGGVTLYPEPEIVSLQRIRCSLEHMFTVNANTDMATLITEGVIESEHEFYRLHSLAKLLQTHSCANADARCQKKRAADDSLICRVQRHPYSLRYNFNEREQLYDQDTLDRLKYLDLGHVDRKTQKWKPCKALRAGRWQYPAQLNEHFIPTVPRLFVAMQACTNVQFCDRKFQVAYLAKYAAGVDEKAQVSFSHTANVPHTIDAHVHSLVNQKISGQALKSSKKQSTSLAREMPLTEMIWFCAGLPYVTYPTDMTHVSTMPPEYRYAIVKRQGTITRVAGGGGQLLPVEARHGLPEWRRFTQSQELTMQDYARGTYYIDGTTGFSLRPPELLMFDNLEHYLKWFTFKSLPRQQQYVADDNLDACLWIDGACRRIKLRHAHVSDACQYIIGLLADPDIHNTHHAQHVHNAIFHRLQDEHNTHQHQHDYSELYLRFVDVSKTKRNIVVFTQVTPTLFSRFLIHLMLSMGNFVTEIDLYSSPTMLQAFQKCRLITAHHPTEEDVKRLARKYVEEQLQWLSIGTRRFSHLLQALLEGLQCFLVEGQLVYNSLPLYLQRAMEQNATDEVAKLQQIRRATTVDALYHELHNTVAVFPASEQLKVQQVVPFTPRISRAEQQSDASLHEQRAALQDCIMAIDQLFQPHTTFVHSPLLVGPPGCGKTHILLIAQTYALSKGLNAQLVAITSERARRLGGEHIHLLFNIPILDAKRHTISTMAETTLFRLLHSPIRLAALQRIDVLVIEEIGLVSAEIFAVMDLVLRYIRDSPVPMGGVLVLACGDPRQLSPVSGSPIWSSYHLIATFRVSCLIHYVRAQRDPELQTLLKLLRKGNITDDEIHQFERIIRHNSIPLRCVARWDDVPPHVLRVVGTRKASQHIVNEFLQRKITDPTVDCVTYLANDEIETAGGQVRDANEDTKWQLDYKCQEPSSLIIFVGAVMRLTYNNINETPSVPRFSQGQLCVVQAVARSDQVGNAQKITVKLVPPGVRSFDVDNLPAHWKQFGVKRRATQPIVVGPQRTKAWRKQFPLCYFVCTTIHKALGETLPSVATQLSLKHKEYRLWEREQLLVLLSRVPTLHDITFVTTDAEDTIAAMLHLLRLPSRWANHVDTVLQTLDCHNAGPRVLHHIYNPLPGMLRLIPDVHTGFVYVIVSTKECRYAYVGETSCIRRRLQEHNNGHGSSSTNQPYLRPWALMVLISGFPATGEHAENIAARKSFEAQWHFRNGTLPTNDVRGIIANGQQVFAVAREHNANLLWQEFARVLVVDDGAHAVIPAEDHDMNVN